MSTGVRIIKNTSYLYAKVAVNFLISLWTTRLILASLGASDFGIYNVVGGALTMLGFLNSTLSNATQRFISYSQGEGDIGNERTIFNISVVLHLLVAALTIVVYVVGGLFLFNGVLNIPPDRLFAAKVVYGALIVSTVFTVMTVPYDAVVTAHENMLYYAVIGIIVSLLKLFVAFICVKYGGDRLIIYGILMSFVSMISMAIMRVYCRRKYEECYFRPKQYWDKGLLEKILSYTGWNFLGATTSLFGRYGQNILVNHFFGVIVNAAQGVVSQLQGQILVFTNNMTRSIRPVIIKSEGAGNRPEAQKWSIVCCRFSFILLAWLAIPVIVEAPIILDIWLKDVPEWTIVFLRLSLMTILMECAFYGLGTALEATGHIKTKNIQNSVLNLAPLVIEWILFKSGASPVWMYITMFAMSVLKQVLLLRLVHIWCTLPYSRYIRSVAMPITILTVLTLLSGLFVTRVFGPGFIRLVLNFAFMWGVFFSISWFFVMTDDEREFTRDLVKRLLRQVFKKQP
ncbi:MAG: hypothetical protein IJM41_02270 [Bacteroidales bacterium]|nr:hypothetical protein [Bacteroidales bacterium]